MHEMSIAQAIWDLAQSHVPDGTILKSVRIQAGPMRAIEPQSMAWAWQAFTFEKKRRDVRLVLVPLPWQMRCSSCGARWNATELPDRCACGSGHVGPIDGDELQLLSIEVDDLKPQCPFTGDFHESQSRPKCAQAQR